MSSQVVWKQRWGPDAETALRQALTLQHCPMRELPSQQWDPAMATIGGVRDYMTSYLARAADRWSSIMLHLDSLLAEPLAAELSRLCGGPAIAFLEYDQLVWGYHLSERGRLIDKFWSIPRVVAVPPEDCAGNPAVVSRVFGVSPESVSPYIPHIDDGNHPSKAFDDDEFTLADHWVRIDFMRRLGLAYPNPGKATDGRHVFIVESIWSEV